MSQFFSIITCTYNSEIHLPGAISSLRSGSFHDYEHIFVDGASKDGTLSIIRQQLRPADRLHSAPDKGIYDALNKGLDLARGEVVGLLHSDDRFASDRVLERIHEAFLDPEVDAVYGDLRYISAGNPARLIREWKSNPFEPTLLKRGWMPPHPTLFLRKRRLDAVGRYDTSMHIAADYDFILRLFKQPTLKTVYLPETLVLMQTGGASNRSLGNVLRKSSEDLQALRRNGVGGWRTLAWKNVSKLGQFF